MNSLNPALTKEICLELFKSIKHVVTFPSELQNFMLSSKEAFNSVCQTFTFTNYVEITDNYVVTHLIIDKRHIPIRLPLKAWYCKILYLVAASAMKKVHIDSFFIERVSLMIKAINNDVQIVSIDWNHNTHKVIEAFNDSKVNISKFSIYYTLPHCHERFQEDIKMFAVSCRTLQLAGLTFEMFNNFEDLNNPHLHQIRHLIIKYSGANHESIHQDGLEAFAQFIAKNFSGLKLLTVGFFIADPEHSLCWNWNVAEIPTFLTAIPPTIKGLITLRIMNSPGKHFFIPTSDFAGLERYYDHGTRYAKIFQVNDNLNLKLELHNYF